MTPGAVRNLRALPSIHASYVVTFSLAYHGQSLFRGIGLRVCREISPARVTQAMTRARWPTALCEKKRRDA